MPVSIAAPSLVTMYERVPPWSNAAVIAVSQSGQGSDDVEVARAASGVGALTVAVVRARRS